MWLKVCVEEYVRFSDVKKEALVCCSHTSLYVNHEKSLYNYCIPRHRKYVYLQEMFELIHNLKKSNTTHRFSVTLSFAPKRSSDGSFTENRRAVFDFFQLMSA